MPSCEICGKTFERHFGQGNLTEGGSAFKCPDCTAKGLDTGPSPQDEARREAREREEELKRVSKIQPVATRVIVGICAAVFVLELFKGASWSTIPTDLAIRLGADYGPLTLTGQWWRLVTSMFLHFGIIHLALNMWCLWSLGSLAERLMGRAAFILLYFATGLAGGLLSLAVHPETVSAGASGAVFGVSGGLITYLYLKKTPLGFATVKGQLKSLWVFLAYNLFYSLRPGIDLMAHAGGLAMGLALGVVLPSHLLMPVADAGSLPLEAEKIAGRRLMNVALVSIAAIVIGGGVVQKFRVDDMFVIASLERIDDGHAQEVLPRLTQIAKKQQGSALAHYALASALLKMGRAADALAEFEAANRLDSADPYIRRGLADASRASGRNAEAVDIARKLLVEAPDDAETHAILGQAEIGLGMVTEGIAELQKAAKLDPNDPDVQARLRTATEAMKRSPAHSASPKP